MNIEKENAEKFSKLAKLNFPLGQYAITGSGPMGIRNLRKINDIDIIVSQELWDKLVKEYGVTKSKLNESIEIQKIVISPEIEAFGESSFISFSFKKNKIDNNANDPTVTERIKAAEIINGLAFESLEHNIYFKQKMGREKDLKDIEMIKAWQGF